jgi:hypothetical protein
MPQESCDLVRALMAPQINHARQPRCIGHGQLSPFEGGEAEEFANLRAVDPRSCHWSQLKRHSGGSQESLDR